MEAGKAVAVGKAVVGTAAEAARAGYWAAVMVVALMAAGTSQRT